MTINTDKLLNKSSGRLVMQKAQQERMIGGGSANIVLSKKSIKSIEGIKINVIKIEDILKGSLALDKKQLDDKKKATSRKRKEDIETKLETKPNVESGGKVKLPAAPRMGILDWIKNFIGNIILGYFAVRLIEHLPKIMPILKFLGNAADFIIDIGGKFLNGLVTFIDIGYKAYDATRGLVKNLFGKRGENQFDQLSSTLNTFLNTVIIAGMLFAGSGGFGGGSKGGGSKGRGPSAPGTRGTRTISGGGPQGKPDIRNPLRQTPKVTTGGGGAAGKPDIRNPLRQKPKVTTGGGGGGGKLKLPKGLKPKGGLLGLVFLIPDLIESGMLVSQGRGKDGIRTLISAVAGVAAGMAAYAAVLAGVAALGISVVGIPAAIALAIAGFAASYLAGEAAYKLTEAGLRKMGLVDNDPKTGKPYAYKSGGITRGGKSAAGTKRTFGGMKKKQVYKRTIAQKPSQVQIKPGADVGGEDKIFGIFPNPLKAAAKVIDTVNPFNVIKTVGEDLGKTDYFGPILAITSKMILGQKPDQMDYKNVGLGLNLLIAKGVQDGQLKGGIIPAFAEGGLVDPDVLSAIETGGDISSWVSNVFRGEIETGAQKTMRLIKENMNKKKAEQDDSSGDGDGDGDAGGDGDFEAGPSGTSGDKLTMARNLMRDLGLTADQAAGIVGNMDAESGVENARPQNTLPGTKGVLKVDDVTGYGIVQWTSRGRQQALADYAKSRGADLSKPLSMDIEYQFFLKEFKGAYGQVLSQIKQAKDVKTASTIFMQQYEVPEGHKTEAKIMERYNKSKPIYDKLVLGQGKATEGAGTYMASSGGSMPLGTGYGSGGSKIAGDLGDYMKQVKIPTGEVHQHPKHPGWSRRSYQSYHNEGRAIDLGGYGPAHPQSGGKDEQAPIIKAMIEWNKKNNVKPVEVIHGSPAFRGFGKYESAPNALHSHHVHAAYQKGGETLGKPHLAMLGEDGEEGVIDADSYPYAKDMLLAINQAKGYKGVMAAISQYAPYDTMSPQTIVIPRPSAPDDYDSDGGGGEGMLIAYGGGGDDPFSTLYQGG